jgi:N-acyl-D-amino-acid deacylase
MQEGKIADIVVFDPERIRERSTFSAPNQSSVGVRYLLVGGALLIDKGALVPKVYPRRALTSEETE